MQFCRRSPKTLFAGNFAILAQALTTFLFFTFVNTTRAHSTVTSNCREVLLSELYGPADFPQSQAWGGLTGRESIYPPFAASMANQALNSFSEGMPPREIFFLLARLRRRLAGEMAPYLLVGERNSFGQVRWIDPRDERGDRVSTNGMAGYSELARVDDGDGSYFRNSELSKFILERFREIVKKHGTALLDNNTRQLLQDEFSDNHRWEFQRRNYIDTSSRSVAGSEIYILKVYIPDLSGDRRFFKSEGPVQLLVVFHPRPNEAFALMNSVFEITNRLIEQKSPVDLMRVLFTVMNATPLHRGSALVSKVYSMALYGYVFEKPMPAIPDGFDVLSMLEPNFETFDERYRPIFFSP